MMAVLRGRAIVLPRRAVKHAASEAAMGRASAGRNSGPVPHVSTEHDMLSLRCWFPRHDGAGKARARPRMFEDSL